MNVVLNDEELEALMLASYRHGANQNKSALRKLMALYTNDQTKERNELVVINVIEQSLGLQKGELQGKSRRRYIQTGRYMAAYFMRMWLKNSYMEIGRILGNRDHSTIMNALDKFNELIAVDDDFIDQYRTIEAALRHKFDQQK